MIAGHALTGWLSDRDAQCATLERVIDARRSWRAQADLDALAARLDAAAGDEAEIAAVAHDLLRNDRIVRNYLEMMFGSLSEDPFFTPPLRHMQGGAADGVRLFTHRDLTLSLVVIDADALAAKKRSGLAGRSIIFSGQIALYRMLRSGGASVQRFEAETAREDFCLADQPSCRLARREHLADGDLLTVDGRRESFTFLHARSAIAYVECEVLAGRTPFRVEYDATGMQAIAVSTTDEAGSRCQLMLSALGALDGAAKTSLYDSLLTDRSFEVRWHAMRELMRTDPGSAWPRLRRLADSDSNLEVRTAAGRTRRERSRCIAAAPAATTRRSGDTRCSASPPSRRYLPDLIRAETVHVH